MAKETLLLKHYVYFNVEDKKPDLTVKVEYRRLRSLYDRPLRDDEKVYDIYIDGSEHPVGYIEQVEVSTSRSPVTSTIRWGIGHHMEWSWSIYAHTGEGKRWLGDRDRAHNYPGLYGRTRRLAIADMLGYTDAEKVQ